jgi:hypothetical protein
MMTHGAFRFSPDAGAGFGTTVTTILDFASVPCPWFGRFLVRSEACRQGLQLNTRKGSLSGTDL